MGLRSEVLRNLLEKGVIINRRGDIRADGVVIHDGPDGNRGLKLFLEGVDKDVNEFGLRGAEKLYRDLRKTPGQLGKTFTISLKLSRIFDADKIAGRM